MVAKDELDDVNHETVWLSKELDEALNSSEQYDELDTSDFSVTASINSIFPTGQLVGWKLSLVVSGGSPTSSASTSLPPSPLLIRGFTDFYRLGPAKTQEPDQKT